MKNIMLVLLLFVSGNVMAQKDVAEEVRSSLLAIFDLVKEEKDAPLARSIVYRGTDKERKWKAVCDSSDEDEMLYVKIVRLKIQKQVLPYEYEFVNFHTETESEGTWHVWELKINKEGEAKKVFFAFLPINGSFALGDID